MERKRIDVQTTNKITNQNKTKLQTNNTTKQTWLHKNYTKN